MKKYENKTKLLGMSFITARYRLDRDIMFSLLKAAGHKCYRCDGELLRENFSVDHKEFWSTANDPRESFFDMNNIAFSHNTCNSAHTSSRKYSTIDEQKQNRLRINRESAKKNYSLEKRQLRYKNTGN